VIIEREDDEEHDEGELSDRGYKWFTLWDFQILVWKAFDKFYVPNNGDHSEQEGKDAKAVLIAMLDCPEFAIFCLKLNALEMKQLVDVKKGQDYEDWYSPLLTGINWELVQSIDNRSPRHMESSATIPYFIESKAGEVNAGRVTCLWDSDGDGDGTNYSEWVTHETANGRKLTQNQVTRVSTLFKYIKAFMRVANQVRDKRKQVWTL
jgi:hypothetical protein